MSKGTIILSCLVLLLSARNGGIPLSSDWQEATALVSDNYDIFMLLPDGLWKYFTKNNTKQQICTDDFSLTLCATYGDNYIYSVTPDAIYKTHISGSISENIFHLDMVSDDTFKQVVYYNDTLFIFGEYAYKFNVVTQAFQKIFKESWQNVNAAVIKGSKMFMATDTIWRYDLETQEAEDIITDDDWTSTNALVFVNDDLYALCQNVWKIDTQFKTFHYVEMHFSFQVDETNFGGDGLKHAIAADKYVYGIWDNGHLWKLKFAFSRKTIDL